MGKQGISVSSFIPQPSSLFIAGAYIVAELTVESWEILLARLGPNPEQAADKYEELRLKLVKFFTWNGSESEADALADETLDRVAQKLAAGEEVRSLTAYAREIARFVWLEHRRLHREDAAGDDLPETPVLPDYGDGPDQNLLCLRRCLLEVVPDAQDRQLILGYYDTADGAKNKDQRKNLAGALGLTLNTMKVKACRLRDRLERCIVECVGK
jgi:DNA-directed RNA polymerase specialized sigma24 family protein